MLSLCFWRDSISAPWHVPAPGAELFPHFLRFKIKGHRRTTENHLWGWPDRHHLDLWLRGIEVVMVSKENQEEQKHQHRTLFSMFEILFNSFPSIQCEPNGFVHLVSIKVCLLRCGVVIVCCLLKGGEREKKQSRTWILWTSRSKQL